MIIKSVLNKVLESFQSTIFFDKVNTAYSDFFQKIMAAIDKTTPYKTKRLKAHTQKWFDSEVLERLDFKDKLFQKFKKSRLNIDKALFKKRNVKP